jgi:ABC-type branched-subunit amino acid transport system substrate-binding protein
VARLGLGQGTIARFAPALLVCCHVAAAAANDDSVARGRRLFETGAGRNGQPVDAVFADSATPIPSTLLSCAGCHGKDGRGRSVTGVDPPDITWQNLTKPYSLRVGVGRTRLPYTEALVVRAVATGRDSSNQPLAPAMPRFRLTPGDAADLIAYLRELGSRPDPGITAETITIGVILPPRERQPAIYDAVRDALDGYLDELRRAGGVFGRRIAFAFIESADNPAPSQPAIRKPGINETVLAAVASEGVDTAHAIALTADDVPLVVVRTDKDLSSSRRVFCLGARLLGELGALAQAAGELTAGGARLAILYKDDAKDRDRMVALRRLVSRGGWSMVDEVPLTSASDPDEMADQAMRRIQTNDAVLFAAWDRRFAGIFSRLDRGGRGSLVLLPGSLVDADALPQGVGPQTRILFAFQPGDLSAGRETQPALARRTTLAATRLLVEGLRRAGRDVSRPKLVDALETIQRFESGYGAPVSYGPRQHVGFTGAEIVPLDPRRLQPIGPARRIEFD